MFNPVEFIRTRRFQLREHTDEEIETFLQQYLQGSVKDYQMAAWLMAVCCHGLSAQETTTLTRCMVESGEQLQWWSSSEAYRVDKHSTGGVSDSVSIVLAPLVASFGNIQVPMMAGRGLAHTGGTIDKLESIEGFRTDFNVAEFQQICQQVGCIINTTGPTLCPADAKLYALRDVTGTVWSIPLITGSIMSKKIAERPHSLVLDIKYGVAAFSPSREEAQQLAMSLIATGEANGLCPTTGFLTRMDHPLGWATGNWLEVWECIRLLQGWKDNTTVRHSRALIELIVHQAGEMLQHQNPTVSYESCVVKAYQQLKSGQALSKFMEMVQAQGGDITAITDCDTYMKRTAPVDTVSFALRARRDGYVHDINALEVGWIAVALGAGRTQAGTSVDPWAGMRFHCQVGDAVREGDVLVELYHKSTLPQAEACYERLYQSFTIASEVAPLPPPILTHRVSKDGTTEMEMVSLEGL
jgi:pyrimidine-nucleoside phosphorylase